MALSEDALIESVIRIKAASSMPLTAKEVFDTLVAEGAQVELSQVKKAASKAAKRTTTLPEARVLVPTASAGPSKAEAKKAQAQADALKAGEVAMFSALRELHQERWMVALHGESKDTKSFIDHAVASAISGALTEDEGVSKERVEADVATLQYVLLPGSPFELPDTERDMARTQLEKLSTSHSMGVGRLSKPYVAVDHFQGFRQGFVYKTGHLGLGYYHEAWFTVASSCFFAVSAAAVDEEPVEEPAAPVEPALRDILDEINRNDTSSLDRAMAKAAVLAASSAQAGGSAMDDMD
eukprot:CAMPEP_0115852980 /NCGR_PEP_ID=MMETSP0287-20121206/13272_1 /TAXON_ID=412157 /ORGANISM="Chrysochromulina rotalis, Strain UIO044" /LENGTH=295 /DNA_ID=CAMNT_0003307051 /DNA_START=12 /DNA_END=899 /DNA_ORIENTATION=+